MSARAIQRALLIASAVFMISVPWSIPTLLNAFWVSVIAEVLIWSLFAASVNLLFGYVGLLSFGQALYFGFGMYGVAIGISEFGLSFWPAFGLGVAAAMAMALITGVFAVRLTWHYFAIITVVFSLIFYYLALTNKWLTGGDDGINFTLPPTFSRPWILVSAAASLEASSGFGFFCFAVASSAMMRCCKAAVASSRSEGPLKLSCEASMSAASRATTPPAMPAARCVKNPP